MSITTPAPSTVTVTIPAETFARWADEHATLAATYATQAADVLTIAREAADRLPADFTTPGGADAAYTVGLIHDHARAARSNADRARTAATYADDPGNDFQDRVWAEDTAKTYTGAAKYERNMAVHLARHLTA